MHQYSESDKERASTTYQEKRQRVQRQTHGMKAGTVEPNLGVLSGIDHGTPGELFIVCGIAISSKTCVYEGTLVFREPTDALWVVRNEPVGGDRDHNRSETFLRHR